MDLKLVGRYNIANSRVLTVEAAVECRLGYTEYEDGVIEAMQRKLDATTSHLASIIALLQEKELISVPELLKLLGEQFEVAKPKKGK